MSPATDQAWIAELGRAGVSTVYEAAGRRGLVGGDWDLVTSGRRVAGSAVTARCGRGDNRAVHEAMAAVRPGDVVVITSEVPEPVAVVGDLLATQAMTQGATGLLVDAAVRDVSDLAGMQIAVATRWRSARGATRTVRGEVNVPVDVGGVTIRPGDVVLIDEDGAAVVPREELENVLTGVRARIAKEADLRARWSNGELSYDVYGLRAQDEAEAGMEAEQSNSTVDRAADLTHKERTA